MSLNKIILVGNLTRDPDLKYTPKGTPICRFSLAVNRRFQQDGEWKTEATFIPIVAWGKVGEAAGKHLRKGSKAFVEGRLDIRKYEKDGVQKAVTEVVADAVTFLDGRAAERKGDQPQGELDDGGVPY